MSKDRLAIWEEVRLFDDTEAEIDETDNDDDKSYLDKEKEDMIPKISIMSPKMNKLVQTPFGPLILDDSTFHPLRGLTIYIAHVNFAITQSLLDGLDNIDGIEAFKQIGRYRIVFVFGTMFDEEEVIDAIEKSMNVVQEDKKEGAHGSVSNNKLKELFNDHVISHITSDFWVAYIFPNGKYLLENLDSLEELYSKYNEYKELRHISGGIIYTSNKVEDDTAQSTELDI